MTQTSSINKSLFPHSLQVFVRRTAFRPATVPSMSSSAGPKSRKGETDWNNPKPCMLGLWRGYAGIMENTMETAI